MRKITVSEFVSLDGVMQAPGGVDEDTDGGFAHGGWTGPYWHDDLGANVMQEISYCDTLLVGRKTWQTHAEAFEPMPVGDPFGDMKAIKVNQTILVKALKDLIKLQRVKEVNL
jgi:dihydrofolate reductase